MPDALTNYQKIYGPDSAYDLENLSEAEVLDVFGFKARTLYKRRKTDGFPDPISRKYNVGALRAYVKAKADQARKANKEKLKRFFS